MGKHGGFFGSHRPVPLRIIPGVSVTTDLALLCDGDRFEITSVEDVKGRGMYLEVMAKVVNPGG